MNSYQVSRCPCDRSQDPKKQSQARYHIVFSDVQELSLFDIRKINTQQILSTRTHRHIPYRIPQGYRDTRDTGILGIPGDTRGYQGIPGILGSGDTRILGRNKSYCLLPNNQPCTNIVDSPILIQQEPTRKKEDLTES